MSVSMSLSMSVSAVCVSLSLGTTIGFHVGIAADEHSGQHRKKQSRAHSCHYCTSVGVPRNTKENEAQNKGKCKLKVWSALEDAVATTFSKWQVGPAKNPKHHKLAHTLTAQTHRHTYNSKHHLSLSESVLKRYR